MIRFIRADVLRFAAHYHGPLFHAILTDPPYHLITTSNNGFFGSKWDSGDVSFRAETWSALASVLHPGAFIMAFASSRGWHRQAVAMEDSGLIIHPSIFGWLHGTGFPKATQVKGVPEFSGHRYGLQALKPNLEPIIVAQKHYVGKPADSITATGAGTLNIDGGRIPHGKEVDLNDLQIQKTNAHIHVGGAKPGDVIMTYKPGGRWPSNFVVSHAPECGDVCVEGCPVDDLVKQNEYSKSFFFNAQYEQIDKSDTVLYSSKSPRSERDAGLPNGMKSSHPTHKPISLAMHLAKLLLPPKEYAPRKIFIPFSGAGSEAIAAAKAQWECVIGVEKEAEYVEIARNRANYWVPEALTIKE